MTDKIKKENIAEIVLKTALELEKKNKNAGNNKKVKEEKSIKPRFSGKNNTKINISILKNLWKTLIVNSKEPKKEKQAEEAAEETSLDKDKETEVHGGYGTLSGNAGYLPNIKYVNYDKIWSHIGNFRSKDMYENTGFGLNGHNEAGTESTREMLSNETIDKATKHFKYFVRGEVLGDIGFVPPTGSNIDSKEWEKYRTMWMMSTYRPLFALKRSTA